MNAKSHGWFQEASLNLMNVSRLMFDVTKFGPIEAVLGPIIFSFIEFKISCLMFLLQIHLTIETNSFRNLEKKSGNLGSNHISIHKIQCISSHVSCQITKKTNKDTIPSSAFPPKGIQLPFNTLLNITPMCLEKMSTKKVHFLKILRMGVCRKLVFFETQKVFILKQQYCVREAYICQKR